MSQENVDDELVKILMKGAENEEDSKEFISQFVLPTIRQRSREEIEREVMQELREIDRQHGII